MKCSNCGKEFDKYYHLTGHYFGKDNFGKERFQDEHLCEKCENLWQIFRQLNTKPSMDLIGLHEAFMKFLRKTSKEKVCFT